MKAKVSEKPIAERKQVKDTSELSYRTITDILGSIQESLYVLDHNWNIVYLNKITAAVIGKEPDDLTGKNFWETYLEGVGTVVEEKYRAAMKSREITKFEVHSNYGEKWYEITIFPTANGITILGTNITERKNAEEALKESEQRYHELFSSMAEMFQVIELIFDKDGKVVDFYYRDVNPALERFAKKTREQLVGKSSKEVFGSVESYWLEVWAKVAKTGEPSHYENYGAAINKYYETYAWKAKENEVAVIISDVTERKQAELKLEEYRNSLEKLVDERTKKLELSLLYDRNLIEASLDPLVTISADGKITDVNKATEQVTGCSRKQLIGSDFSDYFTEPEKAEVGYKRVFTQGFVRDYPLAIKDKSGKVTEVLYNATLYRNDSGEIQGVFAAARDITEQKKTEEKTRLQASLIDLSPDAIMVRALDGTISFLE